MIHPGDNRPLPLAKPRRGFDFGLRYRFFVELL